MVHCINVGLTHWNKTGEREELIKQRSEFFFAPSHIGKLAMVESRPIKR